MQETYTLTGRLKNPNTIELDQSIKLGLQKLKITLQLIEPDKIKKSFLTTLKIIENRQNKRRYISPSKKEIDLYISKLRDNWD